MWAEYWQYQRKIQNPGFIVDTNTAFLWKTVGLSVGEEARALYLTDIATEARNVRDVDEVLIMSKMGTELFCVKWLLRSTGPIREEARARAVSEMRMACWLHQCLPRALGYIKHSQEWTPGFFKPAQTDLVMLIFAIELLF